MRHLPNTDWRGVMALGLGVVLSLGAPLGAVAATYTWTGASGSGNWGTAGNWSAAPTFNNTADLIFSGSVQPATYLSAVRVIRSLSFDANADTAISISLSANAGGGGGGRNLTLGGAVAPTITIDAGASAAHSVTLGSGGVVLAGDLTITHNGPANFSINRPISGAFNLIKTGPGLLTLSNVNTFGAAKTLTLSNGTINVNTPTALGAATCTNKIAGGALDNTSGAAITLANNQPVNICGDFSFVGLAGGSHDLNLGTGAVKLNGAAGARTITVNAGTFTLGGIIGGGTATALTKAGAGTLTLGGANTYSGRTVVTDGTLLVNGSIGSGQVAVTNNGTLGGTGTVAGAVLVFPGSTLAPGSNAVGVLTLSNGVSVTGGTFRVNVVTTNNHGQVKVTGGDVTIANAILAVNGVGYTPHDKDFLWIVNNTGAGSVSGTFAGLPEGSQTNIAGQAFRVYYRANMATGGTNGGNDVLLSSAPVQEVQAITNFMPLSGSAWLATDTVPLVALASSGLAVTNFRVISGPGLIVGLTNLTFTNSGTVLVSADQAGNANWLAAPPVTNTFIVTKATAVVTLNNLAQTYSGSARVVTATTVPAGLTVDITYNGNSWAPTNVGEYAVTGVVREPKYQGTNTGVLVVTPLAGWFSPSGVDVSGAQWANVVNAIDSNTATYASHSSPGANQWGAPLWLTNATSFKCGRVRVYSDWDAGYVDKIRLEIRIQPAGVWTNVYEGTVQNCNWSEITFGSTNIDAARYSYHYVAGGVTFWLYELQFYADPDQVNLPSCQGLDATSVEETSAILHGVVLGDGGEPCQYRFQYGLTTAYTVNSEWSGSLTVNSEFSVAISGLATNSTYHYRAQVKNSAGIASSEDKVLATGLPPTGWVSPTGYLASGAWTNISQSFDDDLNSFATCYHSINAPVWSPYLYLTHSTMTCERVKFNARDTAEIDMAVVEVDLNGVWTSVYSNNTFANRQWVEASFPRGTVTQARVKFSLNAASYGMDWQLNEFKFYHVEGVTLSGRYDGAHRVSLVVDGQYRASFTNTATNVFTFAESIGSGSRILVFYDDDNVATNSGALVTKATGGDMTSLDLAVNTLVLRSDYGAALTIADLAAACTNDADVPYGAVGNIITVASNIALRIPAGNVFNPGTGTLVLNGDLQNEGVLSGGNGTVVFAGDTRVSGVATTMLGNVTITGSLMAHSNVMQVAGDWVQNGVFNNNNGTVDFNGSTIVSGLATANFKHVKISGGLTAPAGVLSVAGHFLNNGSFYHNNGTVLFNGTSEIGGGAATPFGNLAIAASCSLTAPAGILSVSGNWSNGGSFFNNNGSVIFNSMAPAAISGANTFWNFTCTEPGKQMTFTAGVTQTVWGTFTVSGNSGAQVLLRSSAGGSKWRISFPSGPQSVTYADVQDADALVSTVTVAGGRDSGNNNTNWVFASSRYWVGGSGNWSDTNHWAFASGSSAGAPVPDAGNLVVFDANSGAGAQCTLDRMVNVRAMIFETPGSVTVIQGANRVAIQSAGFHQNAGAFRGGSGNMEVAGLFRLAGGVFSAPSGQLTLRSDFTHSGGVFSNQSGTVVFAGTTVMTDAIADPFANVVISNSVTAPAGTLRVVGDWCDNGDFNANNGTVLFAGNTLLSGASTSRFNNVTLAGIVTGNSNAVSVSGSWVNNGVYSHNNGTVLFSGSAELAGASTTAFCHVRIEGDLLAPAAKPLVIDGNWLNNGLFNPNNGTVVFGGLTKISGTSISAFNHVTITGVLVGPAASPMTIAGDWIQNGSFSNQNGIVVFNGNSVIGGVNASKFSGLEIWGHLTAPATNLYVSGDWINYGTFSHNHGSVVFDGATLLGGSMVSDFSNMVVVGTVTLNSGALIGDAAAVSLQSGGRLVLANAVDETVKSLSFDGQSQAAGTWGATNCQYINTAFFSGNGKLVVLTGVLLPVVTITSPVSGQRLPFRMTRCTVAGNAVNLVGTMWYTNSWSQGQATGTFPAGSSWALPLTLPVKGSYTIVVCGTNASGVVVQDQVTVIRSRNQIFRFAQ